MKKTCLNHGGRIHQRMVYHGAGHMADKRGPLKPSHSSGHAFNTEHRKKPSEMGEGCDRTGSS